MIYEKIIININDSTYFGVCEGCRNEKVQL